MQQDSRCPKEEYQKFVLTVNPVIASLRTSHGSSPSSELDGPICAPKRGSEEHFNRWPVKQRCSAILERKPSYRLQLEDPPVKEAAG